jgi:phosphopantothenate---cysteine ligase (CTP)
MNDHLHVVITSGGTMSRIDDIRHIDNFSGGTTGALIAEELLRRGAWINFLHRKKTQRPFFMNMNLDPDVSLGREIIKATSAYSDYHMYKKRFFLHEFETFEEYLEIVQYKVSSSDVDVVILAAAVSDYGAKKTEGKISSNKDELNIKLVKYPKVISKIKQWNPNVIQVGFKLLANVSYSELIKTAREHGISNNSDITVANVVRDGDFKIEKFIWSLRIVCCRQLLLGFLWFWQIVFTA